MFSGGCPWRAVSPARALLRLFPAAVLELLPREAAIVRALRVRRLCVRARLRLPLLTLVGVRVLMLWTLGWQGRGRRRAVSAGRG